MLENLPAILTNLSCGLLGGIIGAITTVMLQARTDRAKRLGDVRFQIYTGLLELNYEHSFIVSSEFQGQLAPLEKRKAFYAARGQVHDQLRLLDSPAEVDSVLDALFTFRFESENDRAKAIGRLIGEFGEKVNPSHARKIKAIDDETAKLRATDLKEFERRSDKLSLWKFGPSEQS